MSEKEALRQLRKMRRAFTIGSICHLLAEANRKHMEETGDAPDHVVSGKCDVADHVLFCLGVGLDSALPQ